MACSRLFLTLCRVKNAQIYLMLKINSSNSVTGYADLWAGTSQASPPALVTLWRLDN